MTETLLSSIRISDQYTPEMGDIDDNEAHPEDQHQQQLDGGENNIASGSGSGESEDEEGDTRSRRCFKIL
jgi:hypothetical protein